MKNDTTCLCYAKHRTSYKLISVSFVNHLNLSANAILEVISSFLCKCYNFCWAGHHLHIDICVQASLSCNETLSLPSSQVTLEHD